MFLIARRGQGKRELQTAKGAPIISKPTIIPELSHNTFPPTPPPPQRANLAQYPPPSIFSEMQSSMPSVPSSPERSHFLEQDPFASAPPSRAHDTDTPMDISSNSIPEGYADLASPSSSHFPLDVKRRSQFSQSNTVPHAPQHRRGPSRTPSLRSYTTFASTSYMDSTYAPSPHSSMLPLMPAGSSTRSSSRAGSRLSRTPTYARRPPPTHLSEVLNRDLDDDSMIGPGDMPPQYMRTPAQEKTTVAGGALV